MAVRNEQALRGRRAYTLRPAAATSTRCLLLFVFAALAPTCLTIWLDAPSYAAADLANELSPQCVVALKPGLAYNLSSFPRSLAVPDHHAPPGPTS